MNEKITVSIGIDVGKKGAITLISKDKSFRKYYKIPLIKETEIDISKLTEIFSHIKLNYNIGVVGVEDVHSIFGASSKANFQFGRCLGLLEGMTIASGSSFVKVKPKDWQKEMWEGVSIIKINTGKKTKDGNIKYKTDTKATSLIAAQRLFPGDKFLGTERSKKPHDGIVDGLLISEYCRRKFL